MLTLAGMDEKMAFVMIGGAVVVFWITAATIHAMFKRGCYERSRREIAAYVAEGSMTPEDGERLLKSESTNMKDA